MSRDDLGREVQRERECEWNIELFPINQLFGRKINIPPHNPSIFLKIIVSGFFILYCYLMLSYIIFVNHIHY